MSESHEVDLDEIIDDDLEGRWFHYIRSRDFGWMARIPDQHHLEVEKDDVIIHKEIKEDSRYPTVRYHLVFEDEAFMVEGDDIRDILAENLKEYVDQHNELPFACHFDKVFKNEKVKITYKPSDYDSFVLKLPEALYPLENIDFEGEEGPSREELIAFFEDLDVAENPLEQVKTDSNVEKISEAPLLKQIANESGKNSVYVFNTTIKEIDTRKSFFQGYETVFYLMRVEGGEAAPDKKKSTLRRPLDTANVKCSENALEKYDLKVGDEVSFNSKYKNDRKLGVVLQRIMKFYKDEEM